jgi:acyl-CoA reductase-like NAD-dependent aldehyde dehydrogenase
MVDGVFVNEVLNQVLHMIDGQEVPSLSGRTFPSINPSTGQLLAEVAFGEAGDVDRAVEAAWRTFHSGTWSRMPAAERARRMLRLAELIEQRADELSRLDALDNGKPISAAKGDVLGGASLLRYFSQIPEHVNGKLYASDPGYFTYSKREPYGVVGAITPWNFPFLHACWKTAPVIAVGNSIVIKMAEQTPISTTEFARLCLEADIPRGVVNVVHGDGPTTGACLAAHPRVPKITFTGSTQIGRLILKAAADSIKSVHVELGGKTPNIVFADSDLEQALSGSLFTSYFNSGQICTTGSRLLVSEDFADRFLSSFVDRAREIVVGDPLQENTQLGPLVSQQQLDRVIHYIDEGKREGASLLLGGERPSILGCEQGYFLNPTVFVDVKPEMRIAQEEIFGPVLSVLTFRDEDEAVQLANDVTYGLAATLWTNDLRRALRLADRLEAGIIWTNCPHYLKWNVPYEGHKQSGFGIDMGMESIETFTKLKVNYINFGGSRSNWA